MQRYTIYLFLWNALHVSGGSSAHHHELKTVYRASDNLSNLLPVTIVAGSSKGLTKYPMLYIQFWAPDDGWRNRPKYVEHFTGINKLCNAASCWLYLKIQNYPWKRIIKKGELLSLITIGKYIWFDALEANKVENILFLKWLRVHWSLWYQHSRGSCGLELWGTEIYPEEVSHKFARNLCTFLPNYMKSHPRRLVFSG